MIDKIVKKMMRLGFTQYEAKAYVTLLQHYPATRYEISKKSGVPRSAIYDITRKLENLGVVNVLSSKPEKYVPLPPEEFLRMLERRYHQELTDLRENLLAMNTDIEPEQLWNITGYNNLIEKAREMILSTKKEIYLSAWNREISELEKVLREVKRRGVKIVIFSFTAVPQMGLVFSYGLDEKELEKVWDHKLILMCDRQELLMGEANRRTQHKAAWTKNKAIIGIAANHIVLDITLYGLRTGTNVSEAAIEMQPGELEHLASLLNQKFPNNPYINLDFSNQQFRNLKSTRHITEQR